MAGQPEGAPSSVVGRAWATAQVNAGSGASLEWTLLRAWGEWLGLDHNPPGPAALTHPAGPRRPDPGLDRGNSCRPTGTARNLNANLEQSQSERAANWDICNRNILPAAPRCCPAMALIPSMP